jgi:SAM-dependent methyltransferase
VDISEANRPTIDRYSELSEDFYDSLGRDGGFARRALLNPAIFRLLGDVSGNTIMDAGCGHGYLSRLLAERGARMVGIEPATVPFRSATRLEADRPQGIRYVQRDLSRLGDVGGPFDAVVANMVFPSIPDWLAALANCVASLDLGGTLVYSLHHPVWVPGRFETWAEKGCVEVCQYLDEHVQTGVVVAPNYHRPLASYLNETIRLGCDIVEVVEPKLQPDQIERDDQEILTRIPNFIVIAARRNRPLR